MTRQTIYLQIFGPRRQQFWKRVKQFMTAIDESAQTFAPFRAVLRVAHYGSEEQRPQEQVREQHDVYSTVMLWNTLGDRDHMIVIRQTNTAESERKNKNGSAIKRDAFASVYFTATFVGENNGQQKQGSLHCVPADGETDIFVYCLSTPPTRAATQRVHYRLPFRDVVSDDHTKSDWFKGVNERDEVKIKIP